VLKEPARHREFVTVDAQMKQRTAGKRRTVQRKGMIGVTPDRWWVDFLV
jgi:hypothetical protein